MLYLPCDPIQNCRNKQPGYPVDKRLFTFLSSIKSEGVKAVSRLNPPTFSETMRSHKFSPHVSKMTKEENARIERKVNSRLSTGYPGCLFLQFCIGFWNQNLDNFP
jgi:hypothetical protein